MRLIQKTTVILVAVTGTLAFAQPNKLPVDISNTFRVEQDDNVFTTGDGSGADKVESLKLVNTIEFLLDTRQDANYLGVRYAPSVVWYEDRPGDSSDINHVFDLIASRRFSPISFFQFRNNLRYAQEPELIDNDVTFRRRNDYYYNSANASYERQLVPDRVTMRLDGRYVLLRYEESLVADDSDYDRYVLGTDLVYRVAPNTDAGAQVRYQSVDYDNDIRNVDSVQTGVVVNRIFNPKFHGDLRGGIEFRDADNALEQSTDSPYVEGSLVFLPAERTRVSVGAGYSKELSPINRFAQQERTRFFGQFSHPLTADTVLVADAAFSMGTFDLDDSTTAFDPAIHQAGDEDALQFSLKVMHRLNVRNSLEAVIQYTDLDSDVRPAEDYDRTRISLGWKYSL